MKRCSPAGGGGGGDSSLVESDKIELAKELEKKAAAKGVKFILPTDVILADKFAADANTKVRRRLAVRGFCGARCRCADPALGRIAAGARCVTGGCRVGGRWRT